MNLLDTQNDTKNNPKAAAPWSVWLLLVPIIIWVLFTVGFAYFNSLFTLHTSLVYAFITDITMTEILESIEYSTALFIIGAPWFFSTIIYFYQKRQGIEYINFVKHTFITSLSLVLLIMGLIIYDSFDSIRDTWSIRVAKEQADKADRWAISIPLSKENRQAEQDCYDGDADACYFLGKLFDHHTDVHSNVKKDLNQSARFYYKGCRNGKSDACISLGDLMVR